MLKKKREKKIQTRERLTGGQKNKHRGMFSENKTEKQEKKISKNRKDIHTHPSLKSEDEEKRS